MEQKKEHGEQKELVEYVTPEGEKMEWPHEDGLSRRGFLKSAGAITAGLLGGATLIAMEPVPYKRGTAWAEKKIPPEYWKAASRFGEPKGAFGKPGEPVKITIGYQPYCLQCMTANINKKAELWKNYLPEGSKVEWFRALSGPLINNNMLAGKNMFGYMCDTPGLRSMDTVPAVHGASCGYDTGEHGAVVVRKDLVDAGKVKEPKDLEGAKIGVPLGSFSHRQALDFVRIYKVKARLLDQSTELQVTHMRAKNIEACVTWEPYPTYLEYLGIGHRLITGLEHDCTCLAYRPQNKWHNWTTSGHTLMISLWLRDRPDVMIGYLKAEEEARDIWTNNVKLASYYVWLDIPEFPQAVVRATMEMNVPDGRNYDPNFLDHQKGIALQWRELGMLTTEKSKDPEKFIEENIVPDFLRLAYKEFKAEGRWCSDALPGFHTKLRENQKRRQNWKDYANVKLQPELWRSTKWKW